MLITHISRDNVPNSDSHYESKSAFFNRLHPDLH